MVKNFNKNKFLKKNDNTKNYEFIFWFLLHSESEEAEKAIKY